MIKLGMFISLFAVLTAETVVEKTIEKSSPLKVEILARKVLYNQEDEEILVEAENAKPGETFRIISTYKNVSDTPLLDVVPEMLIPIGTTWQEGSIAPEPSLVKINDEFLQWPLNDENLLKYNTTDYQGFRWNIGTLDSEVEKQFQIQVLLK